MASEELSLLHFTVPEAIHTDFAEQQRLVADEVLQPKQVPAKCLAIVEIDIERCEIDERQVQVLGGRKVGIGDQPVWIDLLHDIGQLRQESLDRSPPMPP